jgi:hypothetical protein
MHVFYTPRYYAEIGAGHIFPIRKFELVRDKLLAEGILRPDEIHCNTIRLVKEVFEAPVATRRLA